MSKRTSAENSSAGSDAGSESGGDEPPTRRPRLVRFEPVHIPSVSGVKDIEHKALAFKNAKLAEILKHKDRLLNEEKKRIERLNRRQNQDENLMLIINKHWNRLDEDIRQFLERAGDNEVATAHVEGEDSQDAGTSLYFLAQISQLDNEELNAKFDKRVEFTRRAVARLMELSLARAEEMREFAHKILKVEESKGEAMEGSRLSSLFHMAEVDTTTCGDEGSNGNPESKNDDLKTFAERLQSWAEENKRLQMQVQKLQLENRELSLKVKREEDDEALEQTRLKEMEGQLNDLRYELEKSWRREDRLDYKLAEFVRNQQTSELQAAQRANGGAHEGGDADMANVSKSKLEELQKNLEEQTALAESRKLELDEALEKRKQLAGEIEILRLKSNHLDPDVVRESSEYKSLQAFYSSLYDEVVRLRGELEASRQSMQALELNHAKQIESMEQEEAFAQRRQSQMMLELEDQCSQVRKDYELLRIEFDNALAANEQALSFFLWTTFFKVGPQARDVRQVLQTLRTQNVQLKAESAKYKKKWKEAVSTVAKVQKDLDRELKLRERSIFIELDEDAPTELASPDQGLAHEVASSTSASLVDEPLPPLLDDDLKSIDVEQDPKTAANALLAKLSEYRLKLDSFQDLSSEAREKADILLRERKLKYENEKLSQRLKKLASMDRHQKSKYYSEEANKKIRYLEEQNEKLKREAATAKSEEEGLMNEMESTGQAFEELQEQNVKLLSQIREKDDQNLKMMSDRIFSVQIQAKLKEEKTVAEEMVTSLQNQTEAQALEVAKYVEAQKLHKEKIVHLENQLASSQSMIEKLRQVQHDLEKKLADRILRLETCSAQLSEANTWVQQKAAGLQEDQYRLVRLEEERDSLRKKLERAKKVEAIGSSDAVYLEEIRQLKEVLTCPSCKVRRKDGILTKCYHVFCMDCLKKRYDTRRRKCPKCNAAFGANDFRRVYIG